MFNNSNQNFQYNSCTSRGICSLNPRISALQTVLVLYLRLFAMFTIDEVLDSSTKNFILNTISIAINNTEFNEESFLIAVKRFQTILPKHIKKHVNNEDLQVEKKKLEELFKQTSNILNSIRYGEKILNRALEEIPYQIRDLYNIILVLCKSLSINILIYQSYKKTHEEGFLTILSLLTRINLRDKDIDSLKKVIYKASKVDNMLMSLIRNAQEDRYGKQTSTEVSYSTSPSKAILVVGSNIRELETILEFFKETQIDIYTHDDMMLAHTFPKFTEYENLKGQFGQGIENCLLDFATFPGPIILTQNSLHNIENFYRGLLFTTDYTSSPKGIIKIKNNDFREVQKFAEEAKGFKTGKQCESVTIGFDFKNTIEELNKILKIGKYKQIFLIGVDNYSIEQKAYFEKLIKLTPKDVLIISFSYKAEIENLVHINTCFDNYSYIRIFEEIYNKDIKTTIFIPKCEKNTISQMLYLSQKNNVQVYVGKCTPIILNPSLINTLEEIFEIKSCTSSKKDLEHILEKK